MKTRKEPKVRVNTLITGEPAEILLELKQRGIVTSHSDAVIQGLLAFHEKVVQRDLARERLKSLRAGKEEDWLAEL
jgi:hypothetical protein